MDDTCQICGVNANVEQSSRNNFFGITVECENCGKFNIESDAVEKIKSDDKKHLITGYLYETNRLNKTPPVIEIYKNDINKFYNNEKIPKTSIQKIEKLLINLYNISNEFGYVFNASLNNSGEVKYQMGYSKNVYELFEMIDILIDMSWAISYHSTFDGKKIKLTIDGMNKAEEIMTKRIDSKKVFIAMSYAKQFKGKLDTTIKEAAKKCGYEAFTVDEEEHNGDITDKIISSIKTSKFIIADFTNNNSGVYFEAGYAQGRGLVVIKTCKEEWFEEKDDNNIKKNHLHFDVSHYNFILWKDEKDLKEKLINRINATID